MNWKEEKEAKRQQVTMKRMQRILAAPSPRGETYAALNELRQHVMSIALAVESLEKLLVERGTLKENELMNAIEALLKVKSEQLQAQDAVTEPESGRIILADQ